MRLITLAILVALSGCASPDIRTDGSLTHADRAVANRISELAKARCTTHHYDPITEGKRNDDIKVSGSVAVKRMYRSDSGWVKAELVANSVWDNVYFFERNESLVCGEKNWQKLRDAGSIVFVEVGKPLGPSTAAISLRPKAAATTNRRPIALRWEGIAELISGTMEIADGGRTGSLSARLPGGTGATCTGIYEFTRSDGGHWAVSCTNGLSATGLFEAFGAGKGSSGRGKDTNGGAVEFSVGAKP